MDAFIERYFRALDRNLGDPHASKRYPKRERLEDLHAADREIFDALLKVMGQESLMGFSEATITLKNGVSFYQLPEGFRQFLQMERRVTEHSARDIIRTKPFYGQKYGVDVLTSSRGIRLDPAPILSADQDWTLLYLRSTGILHFAKAFAVSETSVTSGIPGDDAGEVVLVPDYYNGMELNIFREDKKAAPQRREILKFSVLDGTKGTFHLRHPFSPIPQGDVWYEINPVLPWPYDSIYAMDVALLTLPRREKPGKAASLLKQRDKKWVAAKQYFLSNVADRGPSRTTPLKAEDLVATGEIPYRW